MPVAKTKKAAKPVAKKSAPKKSPAKKAKPVAKKSAKKSAGRTLRSKSTADKTTKPAVLICAQDAECFWTTDGQILRDLNELQAALAAMDAEVFAHHVREEQNDFAEWVEHVLQDAVCAAELRTAEEPSHARTIVVQHLRAYNL